MMLPYLELPVVVGGSGQEQKVLKLKILPGNIIAYHDGYDESICCYIYTDHQQFLVALSLPDFEKVIATYWHMLMNKKQVKQKLGIVQ